QPGHGAGRTVPLRAAHDEVAVCQRGDAAGTDLIACAATRGADKAVRGREGSLDARGGTPPGRRSLGDVPQRAEDDIVPVVKDSHTAGTHLVARGSTRGADQAVRRGDGPGDCRGPIYPGRSSPVVIPDRAFHHIITVRERRHAATPDLVAGIADEAV